MVVRQTEWRRADRNSHFPYIRTMEGGRATFEVGGVWLDARGFRQLYVARAGGTGVYLITRLVAGWGAIHAYWRPKP
jgi:hypothetical protein